MNQTAPSSPLVTADLKSMPPLPDVAAEILQTLGDEFVTGDQVADIVARDPAVSARLLGLANSAYYGLAKPVTEMRDIVNRVLGTDTARLIAFGLATNIAFPTKECASFDSRNHWQHALAVASACRGIAGKVPSLDDCTRGHAYLMGLCADLGLLVLVYLAPEAAHRALSAHQEDPERSLVEHVHDEFDQTPMTVTEQIARHWELPALIVEAYAERQKPVEEQSGLALILSAAIEATEHADDLEWSTTPFDALGLNDTELRAAASPSAKSSEAQEVMSSVF